MTELDEIDGGRGDMTLGVVLLYWALHERLECLEPERSEQECYSFFAYRRRAG